MKLLLFDIDGTLLLSKGSGRRAMQKTVRILTGKEDVHINGVDFSGRTDPQIIRDVFITNGIDEQEIDGRMPEALKVYAQSFEDAFSKDMFYALPGVHVLIETLHEHPDFQLALLTGNIEPMSHLKLRAIGLEDYFSFGAFGSDHADRYQLPRIAVQRAYTHTGRQFEGKNIVIIGDTKHDILCGRDLNVFSIAVSTGHYNADDLQAYNPDALLEDLSDTAGFLELLN